MTGYYSMLIPITENQIQNDKRVKLQGDRDLSYMQFRFLQSGIGKTQVIIRRPVFCVTNEGFFMYKSYVYNGALAAHLIYIAERRC
jgi:hypothetical protein